MASTFTRRATAHARSSVISVAIVSLLKELEAALDPSCLGIARTAWSQLNLVSGPSNNVLDLTQAVENVVQAVKDRIERPKYTRNFLDKAARFVLFTLISGPYSILHPSLILAKFAHALVKSRPLKETGAEQVNQISGRRST
jgi:hypothetical protein